tara:strand:+ start:159 stop:260 length:102 start_codon:yes stop_codon:yes gene_type:complete
MPISLKRRRELLAETPNSITPLLRDRGHISVTP